MTATWTAPRTWADNELVTAALLNQHLRDNLDFLKQLTNIVIIQDQKADGTAGGSFSSGAWRTRDLNTEVYDPGNYASVASNQITLEAGTYFCLAIAPGYAVATHTARLQNVSDNVTLIEGANAYSHSSSPSQTSAFVIGKFTLAAQKVLELQHQCGTTHASGFGLAGPNTNEIYSTIILIKIG